VTAGGAGAPSRFAPRAAAVRKISNASAFWTVLRWNRFRFQ